MLQLALLQFFFYREGYTRGYAPALLIHAKSVHELAQLVDFRDKQRTPHVVVVYKNVLGFVKSLPGQVIGYFGGKFRTADFKIMQNRSLGSWPKIFNVLILFCLFDYYQSGS
jgi:hypothetical protein